MIPFIHYPANLKPKSWLSSPLLGGRDFGGTARQKGEAHEMDDVVDRDDDRWDDL